MLSYIVISLPLSNVPNCWHERQAFSKMMNQICLLFLFVNYSLEEKRKRNKESHSQFHSRYCSKPLKPNISMHILLTVLCTFLMVLVMRICQTNQISFPFFSWHLCLTEQCHCKNNYWTSLRINLGTFWCNEASTNMGSVFNFFLSPISSGQLLLGCLWGATPN